MSIGSFIQGAITGVVGLGVASWLIATFSDRGDTKNGSEGEEE